MRVVRRRARPHAARHLSPRNAAWASDERAREWSRRTRTRARHGPTESIRRFCTVISSAFARLSKRLRSLDVSPANPPFKIDTDMPLPLAAEADRVLRGRADAAGPACSAAREICITIFPCGDPPLGEMTWDP